MARFASDPTLLIRRMNRADAALNEAKEYGADAATLARLEKARDAAVRVYRRWQAKGF